MSIADKLTELQATKTAIKTAIESKGQSLDGVPFTQYAEVIKAIQGGGSETPNILTQVVANANVTSFKNWFKNFRTMTDEEFETSGISYEITSNLTDVEGMFFNCESITRLPMMNLSKCAYLSDFARGCLKVKEIPLYDTKNVTYFRNAFMNMQLAETVPALDARATIVLQGMVDGCSNIKNIWIKNIKANFWVNQCPLLTKESIIHIIGECRNMGSPRTLTIGSDNLPKIADVYVKLVDITDEMRAEDDLIAEKLPFVVCESTDEGAMLITEYAKTKNWNIAG